MARILIVEDDRAISGLMVRTLTVNGHQCLTAFRGSEAVSVFEKQSVDLVLLDINLPDLDGFSVAKKLKGVPIIYVTARGEISDRIRGLDSGGEDYIVKPFHIQELVSRVNVILRRYNKKDIFCLGRVKADLQSGKVFLNEEEIVLTKREFELLKMLILNKNITLTREQLLNGAWEWDYDGDERTVDIHIQRLRKKLNWESYIKTIYKTGYRLEVML
ncbi:response regulator transcription factor [Lachnospiraceae bacterium 38-14]|jgi:Response regulators consisting of a CheY-like receiver domain and a winged-helix DNA-binding domain|uniref:response regulator transcription factor n=1 Tax=Roseburia sp. 1XD42-69 TaxID=2320088 RepID=UPI000EA33D70|nr:response regulator transcription factor [Roseburia sp. 1XD42-69]RKJ62657.1 DNA-binding response regulator [Roseburia sp. 1XD42-69]